MTEDDAKKYIRENEQLCDLQREGLYLIQPENTFHFGTDSVLLTDFAAGHIKRGAKVADLGTGNGILPVLLSAKTKDTVFTGIEIQEVPEEAAERNVLMNGLSDRVKIVRGDLRKAPEILGKSCFDSVVTNPPYVKADSGIISEKETDRIARHEIMCTLEDVIRVSSKLLVQYGSFDMVNRPERLADAIEYMRKYKIEPREIRFVSKTGSSAPVLFLVHGIYLGGRNLKVLPCILTEDVR